jgi:hypothetical protein
MDTVWNKRHDIFNLSILPIFCVLNCIYLFGNSNLFYWYLQFWFFNYYVIIDTIWLILIPQSVPSPFIILIHHGIVLFGWNIPLLATPTFLNTIYGNHLPYGRWTAFAALVEFNTVFLTAKRIWKHNKIIEMLFFLSWISIRNVFYPYLFLSFIRNVYYHECWENGYFQIKFDYSFLLISSVLFLIGLNFKWSYDFYCKIYNKIPAISL